jgi:hypothetical protein
LFTDQTHTIDAQSTVLLGPDGSVQFNSTTAAVDGSYDYTGAATGITEVNFSTVTFSGSTTVMPVLSHNSGTLIGNTTILVVDVMAWLGGTLTGTGTLRINPGATLSIPSGASHTVDGFTIDNRGATIWANGNVTGLNSAQFLNNAGATFEMLPVGTWGGSGVFQNNGTFRHSGTGVTTFGWALVNAGTIDAVGPSGILQLIGDFTHQDGAVIQGSGTIDYTTATVLGWDGDVNPAGEGATGILNFLGSGAPSPLFTGNIEIGGTTPGTEHDQVTVSQDFVANGTLNVIILPAYTPTLNDRFTVLTYASRTGEFSDTLGTDLGGGLVMNLEWGATSLDLVVGTAGPGPGEQVVFFSDSGGGLDLGVFTVASNGNSLSRTSSTAATSFPLIVTPRWSTDWQRIAYSSNASGGGNNLYLLSAGGADSTELVNNINTGYPRWSPNGTHLGFACRSAVAGIDDVCVIGDVTGPISAIPQNSYVVATATMEAAWRTGPPAGAWDPVSQDRFYFARDSIDVSRIFSMLWDGSSLDTITSGLLDVGNGPLRIEEMDVSSDGSMIVFSAYDQVTFIPKLYLINSNGTGLRQLTFLQGFDYAPVFSPDGTEVLFGRDIDCNFNYNYWIVDVSSSAERQITDDGFTCEESPAEQAGYDWSPDGSEIVLIGIDDVTGWWRTYVVPSSLSAANYRSVRVLVGRDRGNVGPFLREYQPNWRP